MMKKFLTGKIKGWKVVFLSVLFLAAFFLLLGFYFLPRYFEIKYQKSFSSFEPKIILSDNGAEVSHIKTPEPLKAVYMTACVASGEKWREDLISKIKGTEINAFVIDIKDYSGTVSIPTSDKTLQTDPKKGCHIPDIKKFISSLHDRGFYTIARITVFQDPYYAKLHPELAVTKKSDGTVWRDRKGLSFIDVSARPYWQYITKIGKEAYALGFDELNFDYIRFPSDGDMANIAYPWTGKLEKKEALRLFFGYLYKQFRGTGVKTSADLFGMTTTNTDDLNIGQYLEFALPYFDFVSPMVYPSHYPPTWNGYKNPAEKPYEVVKYSMEKAFARASTTPKKLRPWLQDFNLGAVYTATLVRAQIDAVYDSGLSSWMMWSPSNRYTIGALNFDR